MTRIPYDQAAKKIVAGALEEAGEVEIQHEVATEPQWIDVWFEPNPGGHAPPGLLGVGAGDVPVRRGGVRASRTDVALPLATGRGRAATGRA